MNAFSTMINTSRTILFVFLLVLLGLAGCDNTKNDEPTTQQKTVFATFSAPSTVQAFTEWQEGFSVKVEQVHENVISAQSLGWDELIPLYDLLLALNDAESYSSLLMDRSPDSELRILAYSAYAQLPLLTINLTTDHELKTAIETALPSLEPSTKKQQYALTYFSDMFTFANKYPVELQDILEVEQKLTANSLAFYSNAINKSASGIFSAVDFACLPAALSSQIPTDSSGNFVFEATSPVFYRLSRSCLSESVREQLQAVVSSKAAKENSLLFPTILDQRLRYAELQGYDDFSSMRLSRGMLPNATLARELLEKVKQISDPAFEQLQQHYKTAQYNEQNTMPETAFYWSRSRYSQAVIEQVLGSAPVNPKLLSYPESFDRMLYLMGKIVGLNFVKQGLLKNSWNNDVVEYLVYDQESNAPVGTFLLDPFHVEGGSEIASCQRLIPAKMLDSDAQQTSVVTLKAGLKKSDTGQTFISSNNYVTLGHELGHVLHFLLNTQQLSYKSDFAEIPSMFAQRLVQEPQFLKAILSPNPDEPLTELPIEFEQYWNYYRESPIRYSEDLRYNLAISATSLDLTTWQGQSTNDFAEIAKNNLKHYYYPYPDDSQPFYNLAYFVNPATDANYYLYILADVIAIDMLSVFNESPDLIFDQQLGLQYRYHILENSAPDSEAAITQFMGREWNYLAFQDWFEEKVKDL